MIEQLTGGRQEGAPGVRREGLEFWIEVLRFWDSGILGFWKRKECGLPLRL